MGDAARLLLILAGEDAGFVGTLGRGEAALHGLGAEAGRTHDPLKAVDDTMFKVAAGLTVAGGVIAAVSTKMAADFQASTTRLQTQAHMSVADVELVRQGLLKMATEVGVTPTELSNGFYHIASALTQLPPELRNVNSELEVYRNAVELSKIGNADLEQSTQAVIGVLAAYGKEGMTAKQAAAELNAIVGAGDMKMQQLTAAMATGILPAAATFGLKLRDVGAALATLTDNVTPADEAATRLRMTFSLLGAPSHEAQKALGAIGLNATDLGEAMRKPNGLLEALTLLREHLQHIDTSKLEGGTVKLKDLTGQEDSVKKATLGLQAAQEAQAKAMDKSGTATDAVRKATISLQGAQEAQASALAKSGANSEAYHNATRRVETATISLQEAQSRAASSGSTNSEAYHNATRRVEAATLTLKDAQDKLATSKQKNDAAMANSGGLAAAKKDLLSFGFTTEQVDQMVGKLGPTATEQAVILSKAFGGGRTSAAIMTLLTEFDAFREKYGAIDEGAKKFAEDWAATTKTFNFHVSQVKAGLDVVAINLGNKLLPIVGRFLQYITDHMPQIQAFATSLGSQLAAGITAAEPVLRTIVSVVGFLVEHFDQFKVVLGVVLALWISFRTALAISAVIQAVSLGITALAAVLAGELTPAEALAQIGAWGLAIAELAMLWPIALIVLAIAALVVVVILIYTHWDQLKELLGRVWDRMKAFGSWVGSEFHALWDKAVAKVREWAGHIGAVFSGIGSAVHGAVQGIAGAVGGLIARFQATYDALVRQVRQWASAFIQAAVERITQGFRNWLVTMTQLFTWLYNHNYFVQRLVDAIVRWWGVLRDRTVSAWNGITGWLVGHWNALVQLIVHYWNQMTAAVTGASSSMFNQVVGYWNALVHWIASNAGAIAGVIGRFFGSVFSAVGGFFHMIVGALGDFIGWTLNSLALVAHQIAEWAGGLGHLIGDAMRGPWDAITHFIGDTASAFGTWVHNAYEWGKNFVGELIRGMGDKMSDLGTAAHNVAQTIWQFLGFHSPTQKGPGRDADKWMPAMMTMLTRGVQQSSGTFHQAVSQVMQPLAAPSLSVELGGLGLGVGSPGPAGFSGGPRPSTVNLTVNNPYPEPAGTSIYRELRKLSALGVMA